MKGDIEVAPEGDDWVVQEQDGEGGTVLATFEDKDEAIAIGRRMADNRDVEFFIKGEDGVIQKRDSHGNDPPPPTSPDYGWDPDGKGPDGEPAVPEEELPPPVPPTPNPDVVEEPVPGVDVEVDADAEVDDVVDVEADVDANVTPRHDGPPADFESPLTKKPE